jgi:acetolactate synthase I/II/III large subunit
MLDVTGGDIVQAFLEECGIDTAFGVSSIHNMPILDAIGRRGKIRFVPSRGEAGAVNMADGFARIRGTLGVAVTSTGPGAANAAGSLLEAWSAGSPLLHLTGQIDVAYLDRHRAFNHETKDQLAMLHSVSKAAFRVWSVDTLPGVLQKAAQIAATPPMGPVSVEIPIDVQRARTSLWAGLKPLPVKPPLADHTDLAKVAHLAARAQRPLVWIGGGARHACEAVHRLADMGFGVVTSVNGRGVIPEDHPACLGAFNSGPAVEALYQTCDFMLVVGSRLRGNETRNYTMPLPRMLVQIDADPAAWGRAYPVASFICGEAADALTRLASLLGGRVATDPKFSSGLVKTKAASVKAMRAQIGPYAEISDVLRAEMPRDAVWVRDITIANSTWGNRYFPLYGPLDSLYALAGGIGQGMPMGIGAHFAVKGSRKVVVLCGDGGLFLNIGELATAVQERADIVLVVMNDRGYGVIKNIQDHSYGGRHYYADLKSPDLGDFAKVMGIAFGRVRRVDEFANAMRAALSGRGPAMVEVDMESIGPYPVPFGGPPTGEKRGVAQPQPAAGDAGRCSQPKPI